MELSDYQKESRKTAVYWDAGENFLYPTLGLAGEVGEVVEIVKKLMRNERVEKKDAITSEKRDTLEKEMGDVLWYLSQLASEFDLRLEDIAARNLDKLSGRQERGTLHSEGDDR